MFRYKTGVAMKEVKSFTTDLQFFRPISKKLYKESLENINSKYNVIMAMYNIIKKLKKLYKIIK